MEGWSEVAATGQPEGAVPPSPEQLLWPQQERLRQLKKAATGQPRVLGGRSHVSVFYAF